MRNFMNKVKLALVYICLTFATISVNAELIVGSMVYHDYDGYKISDEHEPFELDLNFDDTTDSYITYDTFWGGFQISQKDSESASISIKFAIEDSESRMLKMFQHGSEINSNTMNDIPGLGYFYHSGVFQFPFEEGSELQSINILNDNVDQVSPQSGVGNWSSVGNHGYIGYSVTTTTGVDEPPTTRYGWLEITRGSIILGTSGFQTTAGAGAQISAVPESTSIATFMAAMVGMLAWRRRADVRLTKKS